MMHRLLVALCIAALAATSACGSSSGILPGALSGASSAMSSASTAGAGTAVTSSSTRTTAGSTTAAPAAAPAGSPSPCPSASASSASLQGLAAATGRNSLQGLAANSCGSCATPSPGSANAGSLQGLAAATGKNSLQGLAASLQGLAAGCGSCASPSPGTANAGSLQGLAASKNSLQGLAASLQGLAAGCDGQVTACASPSPGPSANAGSLQGLAASLQGLAAGSSGCSQAGGEPPHSVLFPNGSHSGTSNCPGNGPGSVRCDSFVGAFGKAGRSILDAARIPGMHPSDLASAYQYDPSSGGSQQTVAVVDAYDDPNAAADMDVFRSEFGLPACSSASGCFRKIGTSANSSRLPSGNAAWAREIALDLDMVSAVCPHCKILLVEATSDQLTDLAAGDDAAAAAGATVISNSYYVPEAQLAASEVGLIAPHYVHAGIPITVSSGDQSYGATFPASMPNVFAVGGTTLVPNATASRGWYETAWKGTGAGCSAYNLKPAWQTDAGCAKRTIVDLAVDADPDTGVAVYDTYGGDGWYVEGGTSVGAAVVASLIGLAGNGASLSGAKSVYTYASSMFPIVAGSDGTCSASYLCTAGPGFDGPTGNGSPHGTSAL